MNHAAQSDSHSGAKKNVAGKPRLIIRLCAQMLKSGRLCRQPAVGGRRYCRAHILLQARLPKMARARRRTECLRLPSLTDLHGVQDALARVRAALDAGHLEPERARTLRYTLRFLASCIRSEALEAAAQEEDSDDRGRRPVAAKSNGNYGVAMEALSSRGCNVNSS